MPKNPLRKITSRFPQYYVSLFDNNYRLGWYLDTLECGHQVLAFAIGDTSNRRHRCSKCAPLPQKKPVESETAMKKPPSSEPLIYLRAVVAGQLAKVINLRPTKKNWREYERLSELARRLRDKDAGFSPWAPLGFALFSGVIVVVLMVSHWPKSYVYQAPDYFIRVLDKQDNYSFSLQFVERGHPQVPVVMHFCRDFAPQFEAGHTLTRLAYDNHGPCESVAAEDRGYTLMRDDKGCPVLPANCWHTDQCRPETDHVACKGLPKFD